MKTTTKAIEKLRLAENNVALDLATKEVAELMKKVTVQEQIQLKAAVSDKVREVLAQSKALLAQTKNIQLNGETYNLGEWVTIKEYCQRFELSSTSVLSNWIARGVVPPENIIMVRELNNLKLVKSVPYPH